MTVPHRNYQSPAYRYGFQGQEKDDEIKGPGNSINYKFRMHDPRVGRFFAVDPLTKKYPWYTPYQFSGNKIIAWGELEGLEEGWVIDKGVVKKVNGPYINAFDNEKTASIANAMGAKTPDDFSRLLKSYEYLVNHPYYAAKDPGSIKATPTAVEIMNANPDIFLGAETSIGGGIGIGIVEMTTDELAVGLFNKARKGYKLWKASKLTKKTLKTTRNLAHPEFINNADEAFSIWKTAQKKAAANITNSGKTSLGSFPEYIQIAKKNGHSYFDIGKTWDALAKNGQNVWEINKLFLDRVAKQGDEIIITLGKNKKPGKYLKKEINYLMNEKGYIWKNAEKTILKPKG